MAMRGSRVDSGCALFCACDDDDDDDNVVERGAHDDPVYLRRPVPWRSSREIGSLRVGQAREIERLGVKFDLCGKMSTPFPLACTATNMAMRLPCGHVLDLASTQLDTQFPDPEFPDDRWL